MSETDGMADSCTVAQTFSCTEELSLDEPCQSWIKNQRFESLFCLRHQDRCGHFRDTYSKLPF